MHKLLFILAALLIAAGAPVPAEEKPEAGAKEAGADAKQYEVKITRPLKVGQKYRISANGAQLQQVTLRAGKEEKKQPEEGFGVRLEGTVEVLAVDAVGEESKIACTVEKCTRITGEGEKELVPAGKVVIAEGQEKDTKFTLDGTPLPKEATDALELVISLDTGDTLTDDDLFGTKEKKAVGETWPVDAEAVAKDAARVGVIVRPGDVDGLFKLDGVEQARGMECLRISGDLKMKRLTRGADENDDDGGGLPEGFVVTGGSMEARYSGLFPVDASVGSLAESVSMTFVTDIRGKRGPGGGRDVSIRNRVQRAGEMKRTFVD